MGLGGLLFEMVGGTLLYALGRGIAAIWGWIFAFVAPAYGTGDGSRTASRAQGRSARRANDLAVGGFLLILIVIVILGVLNA